MLKALIALGIALNLGSISSPKTAHAAANPLFGATHMQQSPLTLPAGRLVFGTSVALGVTDFLQVGTDVVRDIYKQFNANAKVSLIDFPVFALTPTLNYENYNYHDISPTYPDRRVSAWQPGLVSAVELLPSTLALIVGGNLNLTDANVQRGGIKTGFLRGAQVGSDISFAYNPPEETAKGKRRPRVGNVLSAGVTYDITYAIVGMGLSHHWSGFKLGVHYYPNADKYKFLPIIAGGGTIDF